MKNKLPSSSGNFDMNHLSDPTRKRKLTSDQHNKVSDYDFSRELNLINDQEDSLCQSVSFRHQFEKGEVDKDRSCLAMLPQSYHQEGSSLLNEVLGDGTANVSHQLCQMRNIPSQTKPHETKAFIVCAEKSQGGSSLQDMMAFGHRIHRFVDNLMLETHSSPSVCSRHLKVLQSNVNHNGHGGNLHEKECPSEASSSNTITINDVMAGTSTCIEQNENKASNNDLQSGSGSSTGLRDNFHANDQGHGLVNVLILEETEKAHMNKSRRLSKEMISHRNIYSAKDSKINEINIRSFKSSDDKNKAHVGKSAPIVAEKLWDGSLQLNSSTTVATVASFKSGEKLPDCKWPKVIQVKGKVRLQAFEKYIQDLPRSRSRGLMVISLHCKEGSSKSGLAGMKEVAKGYEKGERVGFAQFCQGIDLYVCPHSDTIITVLAKHGFFKGMTAVEDNRDSLIGCVVWRRNRASTEKNSVRKDQCSLSEQSLKLSSKSSSVDEKKLPQTITIQESSQVDSKTDCKILDSSNSSKNAIKEPPLAPDDDDDDDDLPEFDFEAARGIALTMANKAVDTKIVGKKITSEIFMRINEPTQLVMQSSEQQHSNRSNVPVSSSADTAVGLPKNLFHDDDDMPEWSPPYAKLQRQVVSETVRPSICGSFPRSSASRLLPPISPGAGSYSRFFNDVYGNCPMDQNAKLPVHPDSWSSWRP